MKTYLMAAALAVVLVSAGCQRLRQTGDNVKGKCYSYKTCLATADDAMAVNDYERAIETYKAACGRAKGEDLGICNDKLAGAFFARGKFFKEQKKCREAIDDYSEAVKLDSNYADAYLGRGDCYQINKDYTHATDDFSKVISINDSNENVAAALTGRAIIYMEKGETDIARNDMKMAIKLDPRSAGRFNEMMSSMVREKSSLDDYPIDETPPVNETNGAATGTFEIPDTGESAPPDANAMPPEAPKKTTPKNTEPAAPKKPAPAPAEKSSPAPKEETPPPPVEPTDVP